MSDTATTTALATQPRREAKIVQDDSAISYMMDTAKFEHCYRVAQMMARASLIPKHLKGENAEQTAANCFLVVNQSIRWGFDPFAVAPETYEVGGKLGFQGKLLAAVINARAGLAEKLSYTFNDKKGDELEVTVSGRFEGEQEARTVTVSVKEARTQNSMWTKDPMQKLVYTGATKWARRHKPEIVLGVITEDDADRIREEERFARSKPVGELDLPPVFVAAPATQAPQAPEAPKKQKAQAPKKQKAQMAKFTKPGLEIKKPVEAEVVPTPAPPAPEPSFEEVVDGIPGESPEVIALHAAMTAKGVTEAQVLAFCASKGNCFKPETAGDKLANLLPGKVAALMTNINAAGMMLKQIKGEA
jgi:hypothetical protein